MAPEKAVASADGNGDAADLAKAFQELAKGERTATALENQLNVMEARIEALLAEAEREQQQAGNDTGGKSEDKSGGGRSAGTGESGNS